MNPFLTYLPCVLLTNSRIAEKVLFVADFIFLNARRSIFKSRGSISKRGMQSAKSFSHIKSNTSHILFTEQEVRWYNNISKMIAESHTSIASENVSSSDFLKFIIMNSTAVAWLCSTANRRPWRTTVSERSTVRNASVGKYIAECWQANKSNFPITSSWLSNTKERSLYLLLRSITSREFLLSYSKANLINGHQYAWKMLSHKYVSTVNTSSWNIACRIFSRWLSVKTGSQNPLSAVPSVMLLASIEPMSNESTVRPLVPSPWWVSCVSKWFPTMKENIK